MLDHISTHYEVAKLCGLQNAICAQQYTSTNWFILYTQTWSVKTNLFRKNFNLTFGGHMYFCTERTSKCIIPSYVGDGLLTTRNTSLGLTYPKIHNKYLFWNWDSRATRKICARNVSDMCIPRPGCIFWWLIIKIVVLIRQFTWEGERGV